MEKSLLKINLEKFLKAVKGLLGWRFFPFITALVTLLCYYTGMDVVCIYYVGLTGALTVLLLDDLSPLTANFLFMAISVSRINSPSSLTGASDYYFQPIIYVQIIIVITLFALSTIFRIATTVKSGKFRLQPAFYGLCALAAALLLNGAFSAGYNPANMMYGAFLAFILLAVFSVMKDNVPVTKETFINIAFAFTALSFALVFELFLTYLTTDGIIVDGVIQRGYLSFGWGMYNTIGMLLLLCIPSVMYLAGNYKHGYIFLIYSLAVLAATVFTLSRQAIVGAAVIYPLCLAILLWKGKYKPVNLIITAAMVLALIITVCVLWESIYGFFVNINTNPDDSNGRFALWGTALENFKSSPLFGTGFYVDLAQDPNFDGMDIVPDMYHNTFMQLLGACGICGLIAYCAHRVTTVISYFKNITVDRTYIAVTVLALLIVNLFDNHLFYLFPTLIYSALISVLISTEKANKPALLK